MACTGQVQAGSMIEAKRVWDKAVVVTLQNAN